MAKSGVKPRMLEIFSGSKQLSQVAQILGWDTLTLDNDPKTKPDICCDILEFDYRNPRIGFFDYVHASVPCEEFSQCKTRAPRDLPKARNIGRQTRKILDHFCKINKNCIITIENPASSLIKHEQDIIGGLTQAITSYCCYFFPYQKHTSIYTNLPTRALELKTCSSSCCWNGMHPMSAQHSPLNMRARIPSDLCFDLLSQIMKYCNFRYHITMGTPKPPTKPPKMSAVVSKDSEEEDEDNEQEQPDITTHRTEKGVGGRPRCQRQDMVCTECGTDAQSTERMYNCSSTNLPLLCTKCYRGTKRAAKRERQKQHASG
jgi:hypothetical protein